MWKNSRPTTTPVVTFKQGIAALDNLESFDRIEIAGQGEPNNSRRHERDLVCDQSGAYGMVFGMATTKITITLPDDQVENIRALVAAGRAGSVSAFVKHAVGVALFDAAGWDEMLQDALQQTGGPLTKNERAWADAVLSNRGRKKGRRKGKAA